MNTGNVTVVIYPQLAASTTSLPGGTQGVTVQCTPIGHWRNRLLYMVTLSRHQPAPWLSVAGSAFTAAAPQPGSYNVTVQVTDSIETVAESPFPLAIAVPVPTVTTASLPSGEATAPYPIPNGGGVTLAAIGRHPDLTTVGRSLPERCLLVSR